MDKAQPGILADNPRSARFLTFTLHSRDGLNHCLQDLKDLVDGDTFVVGFGQSLLGALDSKISGMRHFPLIDAVGLDIPSTPRALWIWLRGDDHGELFHHSRLLETMLLPCFSLTDCLDSFRYVDNRDLSGYEDGTENPQGDDAIAAAIVQGRGAGLDGSSFVAVQQWLHDFDCFDALEPEQQDDIIGRHADNNEEFDEAPESAHVKRSAQESFDPEAFVLRHSMPWVEDTQGGLMFVAFGHSFDAFEAIMNRMAGIEDGIVDGLFSFTHPITGSYFWCPPMKNGALDLSALNL